MTSASTWFDLVLGADVHIEIVPTPAPTPTPFPNPFVGAVFDPIGAGFSLAVSAALGGPGMVLINGMPANTTGTEAINKIGAPHIVIPPGTSFVPWPAGDATMVMGSKTVHIMGSNAVRNGDIAMSCSDPIRLPTSQVVTISKGAPVMVGGPPAIDFVAAAMTVVRSSGVAGSLHKVVSRVKNTRVRNFLHKTVCTLTGHPVDVGSGKVTTSEVDWSLPGPLPVVFERQYSSAFASRDSPLGHGWSHSLDQAVWIERGRVVYLAGDGREIEFDTFDRPEHMVQPGDRLYEPVNRLSLRNLGSFRWTIESADGLTYEFAPIDRRRPHRSALIQIRRRDGVAIELVYGDDGRLEWVRDTGGRMVRFVHDGLGRLVEVQLPDPTAEGWLVHTRYRYSPAGDLAEVVDPLGYVTQFQYVTHLLVRETDRNGLSFHFGYDGQGEDAWCIRTWGDGGLFDHVLDYDKAKRVTWVTDSLGATTTYECNAAGAVVAKVDPLGRRSTTEYDDAFRVVAETDPLGHATRYRYDDRGNRIGVEAPDGAAATMRFDDHDQRVEATDALGGAWQWSYDDRGRLLTHGDPLGRRTSLTWNGPNAVAAVLPDGRRTEREYDGQHNLVREVTAAGREFTGSYDRLGRLVERRDDTGRVWRYTWDLRGQLVQTSGPDGTEQYGYDREGVLIGRDDGIRPLRLRYGGFYKLLEREQGGAHVRLHYDTEDRLVGVENEAGEIHRFVLDPSGTPREEVGFDGAKVKFKHDKAGRVQSAERAGKARESYAYDPCGRLLEIKRSDKTFTRYRYRPDGALLEATNQTVAVELGHDAIGRATRERTGEAWVNYGWDAGDRLIEMTSSYGARQVVTHAANTGMPTRIVLGRGPQDVYEVELEHNPLGLESRRVLPGGVALQWWYDEAGRPLGRDVLARGQQVDALRWRWQGDRIVEVTDLRGATLLRHDARGRLVQTERADESPVEIRSPDAVGNVFRRRDHADREHRPGGGVVVADGARMEYDARGRLLRKRTVDGAQWSYTWDDADCLRDVIRPDGNKVSMTYDAFGRRQLKRVRPVDRDPTIPAARTRWSWAGDMPLHEERPNGETITYYVEPGTFTPMAMRVDGDWRTVGVDQVGAPRVVLDAAGETVWQAELDSWGEPTVERGDPATFVLRWPGQQYDPDVGLVYNRHRWYDPQLGRYISKDPIGLWGQLHPYAYVDDPFVLIDPFGWDGHHTIPKRLLDAMREEGWIDGKTHAKLLPAGKRGGLWQLERGPHYDVHKGLNNYLNEIYTDLGAKGWGPKLDVWQLHLRNVNSLEKVMEELRGFYSAWPEGLAAFDKDAEVLRRGRTKTCPK